MSRFDLTDFEWRVIEPLLPNKPRGVPRVYDRRVLNGVFWVLRSGAPWRDLPERVCLEDGKKFKSLKRHLMTHYGLTPRDYRAKWNLRSDYPMVAPNYAAARSALAKKIGLGRKAGEKSAAKRGRKAA